MLLCAGVTTHGKRQRTEAANRNRSAALEAETVPAGIEPGNRVVDSDDSGRPHFKQREFESCMDIGVRAFGLIDYIVGSIGPAVTNAVINVALQPGLLCDERVSQFRCPSPFVLNHALSPQGIPPLQHSKDKDHDCNDEEQMNQPA
jgi:hypothetical protein